MNESKEVSDQFSHIIVYSKKFSDHHNEQLVQVVRETIIEFANWLHCSGYQPVPHVDYCPRKWFKGLHIREVDETDLWFKFIRYKARGAKKQLQSV